MAARRVPAGVSSEAWRVVAAMRAGVTVTLGEWDGLPAIVRADAEAIRAAQMTGGG